MLTKLTKGTLRRSKASRKPRSLGIAKRGIRTGNDFAEMMSSLMSDLIEGAISPQVGNAACNAGSKLLRVVELQYKYGIALPGHSAKTLSLVSGEVTSA